MLLERANVPLSALVASLVEYRDNVGDAMVAAGSDGEGMRTQDILEALLAYVQGL